MTKHLRDYVRRRLQETNMSGRAAAATMEVSHPYFVRIATGKVERPGVGFCTKLAELFGDSPITVLRLSGRIPETKTDEALVQEICDLAATDRHFQDMIRIYRDIASEEIKEMVVAMAKAALDVLDKRK